MCAPVDTLGVDAFDVLKFLITESTVLTWKKEGLSPDVLSLQNALVVLNNPQAPYFIDPSSNGTAWLKAHLHDARVEVCDGAGRRGNGL